MRKSSSYPLFYRPESVGQIYQVTEARAEMIIAAGIEARKDLPLVDRTSANRWNALVSIDHLVDFTIPGFALPVAGAVDDARRVIEMIYQVPHLIDEIILIYEQHFKFYISRRLWWVDADGHHPKDFTEITWKQVKTGLWMPVIMRDWSRHYVQKQGKITIWPPHAEMGTPGAQILPALFEAILWHSIARDTKPILINKGQLIEADFNGAFIPNVPVPGNPNGQLNTDALNLLGRYAIVWGSGEAEDICFSDTWWQIINYYAGRPEVLRRFHVLTDGTSAVFPDRTAARKKNFSRMRRRGIQFTTTRKVIAGAA